MIITSCYYDKDLQDKTSTACRKVNYKPPKPLKPSIPTTPKYQSIHLLTITHLSRDLWVPSKFAKFTLRLYLINHLPNPPILARTTPRNSIPTQTRPIDILTSHTPLCSPKIIQNVAPNPTPELAKHYRTTGNCSAYWNRGCCYAKERSGRACHLEPNAGEYREAMGGDATTGTG